MNAHETRYWVVGGEYSGTDFRALLPGTATVAGPFRDATEARTAWRRLAEDTRSTCNARFAIAEEVMRSA